MPKEDRYKDWEDLNYDERAEVLEAFQNTEDRNESDKVAPREEDVKDYYKDNAEKFGFEWGKIKICKRCHRPIEDRRNDVDVHPDCELIEDIQLIQTRNRFDGTGQDDEVDSEELGY